MTIMDKMDNLFNNKINNLSEKEQIFFKKLKDNLFNIYNSFIKPILISIFLFWLFTKIKNIVGIQEAIFIQLTIIIIFLRLINSKLKSN